MGQEIGGGCTETGRTEGALGDGEGVKKREAAPGEGSGLRRTHPRATGQQSRMPSAL